MKLGSWRRVKDCPFAVSDWWRSEDFCRVPLPKLLSKAYLGKVHLDALGGSLILSYYIHGMNRFDGWIMNDSGVKKSWTKLFSLAQFDTDDNMERLSPIAYPKDKKQVLLQNDRDFLVVDIENNSVKRVEIQRHTRITSAQVCPGSLLPLGDGSSAAKATTGVKRKRKNIKKRAGASSNKMSDIPSEVFREILVRLPAESLFRFRAVCTEWRRLIDDPSFVKSHTDNHSSSNTLLIRNLRGDPLHLFSLDSLNFNDDGDRHTVDAIPVKQLKRRGGEPRLRELPVASCNGLMLIAGYECGRSWAVWNPLTRHCHDVPEHDCGVFMCKGLGYDYANDDYKVVRIDYYRMFDGLGEYRTHVYSVKLGSWRRVKDCPYRLLEGNGDGVYLNGSLHWKSRDFIIVFDVMTEDFHQLPLPKVGSGYSPRHLHLDALGGSLIVSYCDVDRFDGWVMDDFGLKVWWTELFSLRQTDAVSTKARLRPVAYLKDKKRVLLQNDRAFLVVNIEENSVRKVKIHRQTRITSAQICPGSLVRLGDGGSSAAKGTSGVKRKRGNMNRRATSGVKRKRENMNRRAGARLTFCVKDVDDGWYFSDLSFCCLSGN